MEAEGSFLAPDGCYTPGAASQLLAWAQKCLYYTALWDNIFLNDNNTPFTWPHLTIHYLKTAIIYI